MVYDVPVITMITISRGSVLLSRLVLLHPNLFLGSVWLGLAFSLPNQERYEAVAYWEYFVKESTPENICKNVSHLYWYLSPYINYLSD